MNISFNIEGHAWVVPKAVQSIQIEQEMGWPEGWSIRYSGVRKRHWVDHPESNGELGAKAALQALKAAKMTLKEVDLIIFAGATYDYPLPNQSSIIKSKLDKSNAVNIACIDVDTTCLSFISALEIAIDKIAMGRAETILLVSSEVASNGLDSENRETYTLFGDAAAAFVLKKGNNITLMNSMLKTYSAGAYDTIIEGGGNKMPPKIYDFDAKTHSFRMNGKRLLRLAKRELPIFMTEFFGAIGINPKKIEHCIPHQASKSGLIIFESCFPLKKYGVKVVSTLEDYGNCIAASIPMTLSMHLEKNQIIDGERCLLVGTSAGFGIGAALLQFNKIT